MKVRISIEYFTSFGESVCMVLRDGKVVPMQYVLQGVWMTDTEIPASASLPIPRSGPKPSQMSYSVKRFLPEFPGRVTLQSWSLLPGCGVEKSLR